MATLTIRLPDDKHARLKQLAATRGLSVNKLVEELSTIAIVEFDIYIRFKAMAVSSSREEGLKLLAKLDALERQTELHQVVPELPLPP